MLSFTTCSLVVETSSRTSSAIMSSGDAHLYGIRKPKNKAHEISSSTTLSFTSTLSSLLSANASSSTTTVGRPRTSTKKADIFASHNKGSKKRALKDISDDASSSAQVHSKTSEEVDSYTLQRSKRKMEEKARLYAAMKRGDYIPAKGEKEDLGGLIDFDRKWAETEARGEKTFEIESDNDGDWDSDVPAKRASEKEEMIEYTDEFGRVRHISKAEAIKKEKARLRAKAAARELEELRARPSAISEKDLIYGNVIQSNAFNPDAEILGKMQEIASKRDRSATPPPETYYEADKEIRTKGVGFFNFSKDEEVRKAEMQALEEERRETERKRAEREEKKRRRAEDVEERRKAIAHKRALKEADAFLDSLSADT